MRKLSRISDFERLAALSLIFLGAAGCSEQEPPKDYVAVVNDKVLSKQYLAQLIDTTTMNDFAIREFINNWIETELLAQAALEEGIEHDERFLIQHDLNERKLLAGIYLQDKIDSYNFNISSKEVEEYFNTHKAEFELDHDIYKVNQIVIKDLKKAIDLRNTAILKLDFKNAIKQLIQPEEIIDQRYDVYIKDFETMPYELSGMIESMSPGEITYPIELGKDKFLLTQLVDKNLKRTEPKFDFIKELIIDRITAEKRKSYYMELINELIEKADIKIKESE